MEKRLKYIKADVQTDVTIKSMVLLIGYQVGDDIVELFCREKDWLVSLPSQDGSITIPWEDFVEIFSHCSLFIAEQNRAMLRECEESNTPPEDEEEIL